MTAYLDAFRHYFDFSGRTGRGQYWQFLFIYLVVTIAALFADAVTGNGIPQHHYGVISLFVGIVHICPQISATVRRLHDIGRSGWWYLLYLVPFGGLVLLVMLCRRSEAGANPWQESAVKPQKEKPIGVRTAAAWPSFDGFGQKQESLAGIRQRRAALRR